MTSEFSLHGFDFKSMNQIRKIRKKIRAKPDNPGFIERKNILTNPEKVQKSTENRKKNPAKFESKKKCTSVKIRNH